jgi:Xaa-Pro dipeptidase
VVFTETLKTEEELEKTCAYLQRNGIDAALLTSMENVTYVSGFEVPIHVGPSHAFSGMSPMALVLIVPKERSGWLIVADSFAAKAKEESLLQVVSFDTFDSFSAVNSEQSYLELIRSKLEEAGLKQASAVLGIEAPTFPHNMMSMLQVSFAGLRIADAIPSLQSARWIKTKREIRLLKQAAQIVDAGQQALVRLAERFDGGSEIDLWKDIEHEMIRAAGGRITITGEFVTGDRIGIIAPGGPVSRVITKGDMGLMDISPRKNGYWADCTNTVVFGGMATAEQKKYFNAAREAFEAAVEALRPGVRCCDVEQAVQKAFARNGMPVAHYSGHQIGVSVNEMPRLVQYDQTVVEAGMVFAIEPGAYAGQGLPFGARAERMVVVMENGVEILNEFDWGLM